MLATVKHVWPGRARVTVIVEDRGDHRVKSCFVWTDTSTGQLIASLCDRVSQGELGAPRSADRGRVVVLTVKPKHAYYGFEIEAAELLEALPGEQSAS